MEPKGAGDLHRDVNRYLVAALIAVLPCLAFAVHVLGTRILLMTMTALAAWLAVEFVFARVRGKPTGGGGLVFALLLALVVPPAVPLWMVATGAAFGCLFAKEVFGGTGHHVFNPVLVAKAFITFSYPAVCRGRYFGHLFGAAGDSWIPAATLCVVAAVVMTVVSPRSIWIYAGLLMGLAGAGWAIQLCGRLPYSTLLELTAADGTLFMACFLAPDPAGAPRHRLPAVLFGLVIGTAAAVMRSLSTYSEAMMCAVLLGNLCAPTFDVMNGYRLGRNEK